MQQFAGKASTRIEADLQALYQFDLELNAYRGSHQDPVYREKLTAAMRLYSDLVEVGAIAGDGSSDGLPEDDWAGV